MGCDKSNRNKHAIFRDSNLNRILNVLLNWIQHFSVLLWQISQTIKGFSVFGPIIFVHFWQICQKEMSHFFEKGSKVFSFKIKYIVNNKVIFLNFEISSSFSCSIEFDKYQYILWFLSQANKYYTTFLKRTTLSLSPPLAGTCSVLY